MDPEKKAAWLHALRSGEWIQARNVLKSESGNYCCLGVACELALRDNAAGVSYWEAEYEYKAYYGEESDNVETYSWSDLPVSVQKWLGLPGDSDSWAKDRDPIVTVPMDHAKIGKIDPNYYPENRVKLSVLNDMGFTFAEIADLIEDQL